MKKTMLRVVMSSLFLGFVTLSAAFLSSCDKDKDKERSEPISGSFPSKHPISGFFRVIKAEATLTPVEKTPQKDRSDYLCWEIVPGSEIHYSLIRDEEKVLQIYKERKMREDVTFYSVIGPFDTFGVYGLQAMTLSFTRDADHMVTDLSSQALLSYEHLYKTYYEREPLAPGAKTSYYRFLAHEVGPKTIREEVSLASLTPKDLWWTFWGYYTRLPMGEHILAPREGSAYLYLKKDAVDLTAGKLVLTFVRDEGNPVKVELPTK